jgi:SAM-dependent methyltransferase
MKKDRIDTLLPLRKVRKDCLTSIFYDMKKTIFTLCMTLFIVFGVSYGQSVKLDVPYVPTRQAVVDAMLKLADVKKSDVLYDLGCGDGRIVVTAAKRFGTKGTGVDIDPQRIKEANANAKEAEVTELVQFMEADLFTIDFSKASVLTLYLLPSVNLKLRPKILSEMKPGSRVVSHDFDMGDWKPEQEIQVDGSTVYLWIVPEKK